jgi:hypothetical protein
MKTSALSAVDAERFIEGVGFFKAEGSGRLPKAEGRWVPAGHELNKVSGLTRWLVRADEVVWSSSRSSFEETWWE